MASNIHALDVDLDDIFKPRITTKISDTGIHALDVDIANTYEGGRDFATKVPSTRIKSGGIDLKDLFLRKDQHIVGDDWPFTDTSITTTKLGVPASAYYYFGEAGSFAVYQDDTDSGQVYRWLDIFGIGNGSDFFVKYTLNSGTAPTYLGMVGGTFSTSYNQVTGNFYIGYQNQTNVSCNLTISIAENGFGVNAINWTGTIGVTTI